MAVPELSAPAELYYDAVESKKYNANTRISKIQREITLRAAELLEMPAETRAVVLDLGCGSGLSGQALRECGHQWVGVDISPAMLQVAREQSPSLGLLCCDLGAPLPFRKEAFEYAVSISAVQWLFQSYSAQHYPLKRIKTFFKSLHAVVSVRAVIQVYCSKKELDILSREAKLAGFTGGLVVDNEGTKNVKTYLVLDKYARKPSEAKRRTAKPSRKRAIMEQE
ncbi:18S rRNA (guanine1575-N7)-methyltransferase [Pancytospora philotis]|nr:18S rRNA (guanine1575-N7)-methyltransferase [Pancytospora philotis]